MEKVKTELWNDRNIRFVNVNGDWMAIGKDVTRALEYKNSSDAIQKHANKKDRKSLSRKEYRETLKLIWGNKNDFTKLRGESSLLQ